MIEKSGTPMDQPDNRYSYLYPYAWGVLGACGACDAPGVFMFNGARNSIFLHDVTIDCVCTSVVKYCLLGTRIYIEVLANLARH